MKQDPFIDNGVVYMFKLGMGGAKLPCMFKHESIPICSPSTNAYWHGAVEGQCGEQ